MFSPFGHRASRSRGLLVTGNDIPCGPAPAAVLAPAAV